MTHQSSVARRHVLMWLAAASPSSLLAQEPRKSAPPVALLQGTALNGQRLSLEALRGQVVLVFYWSTECGVCLSKMPELRANAAGWQGQNFTLLGVNKDAKRETFLRYEAAVASLIPTAQKFASVWAYGPDYRDNLGPIEHLPTACLINKEGQVVERYSGRIPPQAWNRIADLL